MKGFSFVELMFTAKSPHPLPLYTLMNISKVNTYFFYIFINVYKGRGCGDLAVDIGSTNEKPFTNTISNQPHYTYTNNFLTSLKNLFLEGLKHLVPLTVGRL